MTYAEKLKDPRWQKKRLQILSRDKWKCKKCRDTETTLNVHHLEYNGDPWETENKKLVTLCEDCHKQVESLKDECDYEFLKIYKSNNWESGSKIIFAGYPGHLSMEIYDKENNYIIGFNIGMDESNLIMKMFRYVNKFNHG